MHAICGALGLPIYVLRLATPGLDDGALAALMSGTAPRCAVLLEDVESTLPPGTASRTATGTARAGEVAGAAGAAAAGGVAGGLTMSGLLNALDGIGAAGARPLNQFPRVGVSPLADRRRAARAGGLVAQNTGCSS